MTDHHHNDELLKRYWAAESSLDEERELHSLVETGEADAIFKYFHQQKKIEAPQFRLPYEDHDAKVIPLSRRLASVAAVVIVLMGLLFFLRPQPEQTVGSVTSADEAYEELTQALYFISNKMNSGLLTADASLQKVEPIKDIFK